MCSSQSRYFIPPLICIHFHDSFRHRCSRLSSASDHAQNILLSPSVSVMRARSFSPLEIPPLSCHRSSRTRTHARTIWSKKKTSRSRAERDFSQIASRECTFLCVWGKLACSFLFVLFSSGYIWASFVWGNLKFYYFLYVKLKRILILIMEIQQSLFQNLEKCDKLICK